MATMAEISAAINLIDVKKENLHKSFLYLQSQSQSSFNLPLKWSDLDSYFTTLHSSLQSQFDLLQTVCPPSDITTVPARPELKSFCENSDGLGLNRFIALAPAPDRQSILSELPDAYRCAPDAPAMVLDAVASFYTSGFTGAELRSFRSSCSIMLHGLIHMKPYITIELKDKAMVTAVQWNQNRVSIPGYVKTKEQEALGFLRLVGAYGLVDRFTIDEIIDCFLIVAKKRHTIDLFRRILPANNINDMIQKLRDKDMHVNAVNFIIALQKTDEFQPVGLLEDRKLMSLRVIEETRMNEKDLHVCNAVIMKEIRALKSIIKCIDDNHLESEYPKDNLVELVNKLENEVENGKQTLVNDPGSMSKKSKKSKKPKLNEDQPTAESAPVTPVQSVKLIQESRSQKLGSSLDHVGECHDSPLGSGPTGFNAPSAKDSVVELVNILENEVENSKTTVVNNLGLRKQPSSDPATVPARPELKFFCRNSDGLGLNRFIALAPSRPPILDELPDAYRCAPDAPAMVLDAMAVFYSPGCNDTAELCSLRSGCLIMLAGLLRVKPDITNKLKDKALDMAVQWNQKRVSIPNEQKALGFVLLVRAYGLIGRFSIDDIIDCFLIVATRPRTIDLCRRIIPENNIKDMIQKLIDKDMHVTAVKFSIQLQKTDEFPPVGLLEDRKLRSLRVIEETRRNAKDLHVWKAVTMIEIDNLKSIIECIDENHLESVYPKDSVVELVNKLQNELENSRHVKGLLRKQPPRATVLKQQLLSKSKMSKKKSKKSKLNKVQPTAVQSVKLIQESSSQKSDLSPDHVGESHIPPLGSGPAGSNAPSAKDGVVELVNKLENEMENSKQTPVKNLGLRKQPPRESVLKQQLLSKSKSKSKSKLFKKLKKPKLNKVQPTAGSALATPTQNGSLSQKSDSSPDHVVECHISARESGPTGSNAPSAKGSVVELVNELVNEVENSKQTVVNDLGSRKQPARATVLKRQMLLKSNTCNKSKKPKLNKVEPTADSAAAAAAATPVQDVKLIQESRSQKSDLSPDHVGECRNSSHGSGPTGSNAPSASLIGRPHWSARADIGYNFYVPRLQPPSDCNSNGWISD